MISADTSVFVDFFRGVNNTAIDLLQQSLEGKQLQMNPFVLSELLSSPKLPTKTEKYLLALPRMEIDSSFFERAGILRRRIYEKGKGVAIADIYIAQACIDSRIPLLTVDQDLLMISEYSDLDVVQIQG
ncbi:MAG: PIN domain-containing protein [Deltaproteobacteria bacterium]|nr:PIN domain-containing protein [Deltaproteobacteria bacterium]